MGRTDTLVQLEMLLLLVPHGHLPQPRSRRFRSPPAADIADSHDHRARILGGHLARRSPTLIVFSVTCLVMYDFGATPKLAEFFFSSRSRHTSLQGDWSSDVCSSD